MTSEDRAYIKKAEEMMFKLIEDKADGLSTNDIVVRLREAKCPPRLLKSLGRSLILQFKGVGYIVKKKPLEFILSDHNRSMIAVWVKNEGKGSPKATS